MTMSNAGFNAMALLAMALTTGCVTSPEPSRERWVGKVMPGDGWLKRQGVETSYPIQFVMDSAGRASGTFTFVKSGYPANVGPVALTGKRDPDGSAFYMAATVEGRDGLAAAVGPQARVEVALTGFDEEDGSLRGVGIMDMADLACLSDPSRAAAKETCVRPKVPVKWTARKSQGAKP